MTFQKFRARILPRNWYPKTVQEFANGLKRRVHCLGAQLGCPQNDAMSSMELFFRALSPNGRAGMCGLSGGGGAAFLVLLALVPKCTS